MKDLIDRLFTLGLGIAAVSKEQAEKLVDELVEKGNMAKTEASDTIDELLKKGKEAQQKWESTMDEKLNRVIREANLVSRKDFEELQNRVQELEEKLAECSKE